MAKSQQQFYFIFSFRASGLFKNCLIEPIAYFYIAAEPEGAQTLGRSRNKV
jgi:hypothetical protein